MLTEATVVFSSHTNITRVLTTTVISPLPVEFVNSKLYLRDDINLAAMKGGTMCAFVINI